jgi:hypothetical protein
MEVRVQRDVPDDLLPRKDPGTKWVGPVIRSGRVWRRENLLLQLGFKIVINVTNIFPVSDARIALICS